MRDACRIGYAQARIQARFGDRPREAFWRELEAGRDLPQLLELARGQRLGVAFESLAGTIDAHALELRLRQHWAQVCAEIAAWYPPGWRPAMRWLGWLPWLAPLAWLNAKPAAQPWMREDPALKDLAEAEPADRPALLRAGPFAPLAPVADGPADFAAAWHGHWHRTWPEVAPREQRGLAALDALVGAFLPGPADGVGPAFDLLTGQTEVALTRLFRRQAGTPVAGLVMLMLLALDHLRLRAALSVARAFGKAGPP